MYADSWRPLYFAHFRGRQLIQDFLYYKREDYKDVFKFRLNNIIKYKKYLTKLILLIKYLVNSQQTIKIFREFLYPMDPIWIRH